MECEHGVIGGCLACRACRCGCLLDKHFIRYGHQADQIDTGCTVHPNCTGYLPKQHPGVSVMKRPKRQAFSGKLKLERLVQLVLLVIVSAALAGYFFGAGPTKVHLDSLILLLLTSAIGVLLMQMVFKTDFRAF